MERDVIRAVYTPAQRNSNLTDPPEIFINTEFTLVLNFNARRHARDSPVASRDSAADNSHVKVSAKRVYITLR